MNRYIPKRCWFGLHRWTEWYLIHHHSGQLERTCRRCGRAQRKFDRRFKGGLRY